MSQSAPHTIDELFSLDTKELQLIHENDLERDRLFANIRRAREASEVELGALADELGWSEDAILEFEAGELDPTVANIMVFLSAVDASISIHVMPRWSKEPRSLAAWEEAAQTAKWSNYAEPRPQSALREAKRVVSNV